MAVRAFALESVRRGDEGFQRAFVMRCGGSREDGSACESRLDITVHKSTEWPPEAVNKRAVQKGWRLGKKPTEDRCPDCIRREHPRKGNVVELKPTKPTAETPSKPDRDAKRIIFAKLEEVYVGEPHGYAAGWGDQRVAGDLHVPRAWVAEIRGEFFGDAKGNEEAEALLAEIEKLRPRLEAFARDRQAFVQTSERLAADVTRLLRAVEDVKKSLAT